MSHHRPVPLQAGAWTLYKFDLSYRRVPPFEGLRLTGDWPIPPLWYDNGGLYVIYERAPTLVEIELSLHAGAERWIYIHESLL